MQYLGGKSRIAKQIAKTMLELTDERKQYIEPFAGAASVAVEMAPFFEQVLLSDASPDLIALWRALQLGWEPPTEVSEELYRTLRTADVSPLRGFVGYGCSFGGKWFGGYASNKRNDNYAAQTASSLCKKMNCLSNSTFCCSDYRDLIIPDGSIVYLDPPYANTTGYTQTGVFDSQSFWRWAESLSQRAIVFSSSYAAPPEWKSVWHKQASASLRKDNNTLLAEEHLWVYGPSNTEYEEGVFSGCNL